MAGIPTIAVGQPADPVAPPQGDPTALSLETLGASDSQFAFYGIQGVETLSVPVPRGMVTLEVEIPNNGDSQPTWRLYRVNKPVPLG